MIIPAIDLVLSSVLEAEGKGVCVCVCSVFMRGCPCVCVSTGLELAKHSWNQFIIQQGAWPRVPGATLL